MESIPQAFWKSLMQHKICKRKDLMSPKWSITVSESGIQVSYCTSIFTVNCRSKASIIWRKIPDGVSEKWSIKKSSAPTKMIIKKEYTPVITDTPVIHVVQVSLNMTFT